MPRKHDASGTDPRPAAADKREGKAEKEKDLLQAG